MAMALGIRLPFAPVNEARDFVGVVLGIPSPTPGLVGTPGRGVLLFSPNPGVPIEDVLRLLSTGAVFVLVRALGVRWPIRLAGVTRPEEKPAELDGVTRPDADWERLNEGV